MKHLLAVVLIAFSLNGFTQQKPVEWHTDVNKAINISVETGKPLFFFFTGSDWCGWCKRLQKEVFFKPEFAIWANKNVVLVELDFPRRTKLSAELQKQNRELGQMFGVRGYPTIWFVNPEIQESKVNFAKLGSQGYVAGGPKAWIAGALAKLTTSGQTTSSEGFLGKLNSMLFSGVDPTANGVAEAMIYNDLFGKIGFVTIGIALLTLLISPIIKKLMHDIH